MNKAANTFMLRHGMHPDCIELETCCNTFQEEMRLGLEGQPSSLMMLPAYVTLGQQIKKNESAVVLDAGGTNLRIGICKFTDEGAELSQVIAMPMPGTSGQISLQEFVSQLADLVEPLVKSSPNIGLCFSFPAKITPDLDGIPLEFNKEVDIRGLDGTPLCAKLCDELKSRGLGSISYALVNDTVAALLGGYGSTDPQAWDGFIGLILGTGTNCCYTETVKNIKSVTGAPDQTMVVNMEAGGYGRFPSGDYDKIVDVASNNPGEHIYEKMVSGGYLGQLAKETLAGALREGILSGSLPEQIESKDVTGFLEDPGINNYAFSTINEKERLYTIFDLLLERAAKMVASGLVAIMLQGDMGKSPIRPACIVVEGSTLLKSPVYQRKLEYHMQKLAVEQHQRYFRFRSYSDTNMKGAATAVLLK